MIYRWADFSLDPDAMLMTCAGRHVDMPRKQLRCIGYLLAHRDRAITFDELIQAIWDHGDASNQQLAQIVLATRRTIGDNGQSQHSIRTVSGIGYRWVAPLHDEDADPGCVDAAPREAEIAPPLDPSPPSAPHPDAPSSVPDAGTQSDIGGIRHPTRLARAWRVGVMATLSLVLLGVGPRQPQDVAATEDIAGWPGNDARAPHPEDPIRALRQALFLGHFEVVREGLATLPPDIADGLEARLIDIELDIRRGRFSRAAEKLAAQNAQTAATDDTIRRARLLLLQSELNNRMQLPGEDILAPAQSAIELLEAADEAPPPDVLALALWFRAHGSALSDRFEDAQRDLLRAGDLYQRIGEAHRRAEVRASLARVWMRTGRLSDALEELRTVADEFGRFDDKVREIFARNTMTKIEIELLRWDEALASNDRSMALLREVPDSERRYPTLQLRAMALIGLGRLREAGMMLDEADSLRSERHDNIAPAIHHLEAGRPHEALKAAAQEFEDSRIDNRSNLLLENRDGALLVWMAAARQLSSSGEALPSPSAQQLERLRTPGSLTARIARGYWLAVLGDDAKATTELRAAFDEAKRTNQPYRMRWAAEPLIELLLERGEIASARDLLVRLRSQDPVRIDSDYRVNKMRLRVALREQGREAIEEAYRGTVLTAGERKLPDELAADYLEKRSSASLVAQ